MLLLLTAFAQAELSCQDSNSKNAYEYNDGVLVIKSSMGIGRVRVTPKGEKWPALYKVRFEYLNGTGMARLEGLSLHNDFLKARGASRTQHIPFRFLGEGEGPSGTLSMTLKMEDGALTLTLPPNLASASEFLEIHWVDVYR